MKYIIGIVAIFAAFIIFRNIRVKLRLRKLPQMTTDDIRALFNNRDNHLLFVLAVKELQKRKEDINFTFPIFMDMVVFPKEYAERIFGWSGLTHNFSKELYNSGMKSIGTSSPSEKNMTILRGILEKWETEQSGGE